jgi:hypothetical protein
VPVHPLGKFPLTETFRPDAPAELVTMLGQLSSHQMMQAAPILREMLGLAGNSSGGIGGGSGGSSSSSSSSGGCGDGGDGGALRGVGMGRGIAAAGKTIFTRVAPPLPVVSAGKGAAGGGGRGGTLGELFGVLPLVPDPAALAALAAA